MLNPKSNDKIKDINASAASPHHTLGPGPTQAAPGNHGHDYSDSDHEHDYSADYAAIDHTHDIPDSEWFIGDVKPYLGSTSPSPKWMILNGSEISRTTYSDLWVLLGSPNTGNGTTTFNLPDVRNKVLSGVGNVTTLLGSGGSNSVVIAEANLPPHEHKANWAASTGTNTTHYARGNSGGSTGQNLQVIERGGFPNDALDVRNSYFGVNYLVKVLI